MKDNTKLLIISGSGGDGAISGVRKKFIPRGGPDGGDGGDGGNVVLKGNKKITSLKDVSFIKKIKAENGFPGTAGNKKGRKGKDKTISLPLGTVIYKVEGKEKKKIHEILQEGKKTILEGGRGGRGNAKMANSVIQYPLLAEKGEEKKQTLIEIDFIMESDIAIIGKPNTGKSYLLSKLTNAKPAIKNYPYTTISTETGIIETVKRQHKIIEVPGIEDKERNIGKQNLKHTERCKVFVFIKESEEDKTIEIIKKIKPNIFKNKKIITVKSYISEELKNYDYTSEEVEKIKKSIEVFAEQPAPPVVKKEEEPDVIKIGEEKELVEKSGENFIIKHQQVIRIAERVNLDHWDVMAQFMKVLHNKGVSKKLFEMKIKPGDIVKIGRIELEWS